MLNNSAIIHAAHKHIELKIALKYVITPGAL